MNIFLYIYKYIFIYIYISTWYVKIKTLTAYKKVVSDSLGLVDFAIELVNSVFNLPNWQVMFFEEFE